MVAGFSGFWFFIAKKKQKGKRGFIQSLFLLYTNVRMKETSYHSYSPHFSAPQATFGMRFFFGFGQLCKYFFHGEKLLKTSEKSQTKMVETSAQPIKPLHAFFSFETNICTQKRIFKILGSVKSLERKKLWTWTDVKCSVSCVEVFFFVGIISSEHAFTDEI